MKRDEQKHGRLNPKAPQELSQFAFLLGKAWEEFMVIEAYRSKN
jgi:hypothetical protein